MSRLKKNNSSNNNNNLTLVGSHTVGSHHYCSSCTSRRGCVHGWTEPAAYGSTPFNPSSNTGLTFNFVDTGVPIVYLYRVGKTRALRRTVLPRAVRLPRISFRRNPIVALWKASGILFMVRYTRRVGGKAFYQRSSKKKKNVPFCLDQKNKMLFIKTLSSTRPRYCFYQSYIYILFFVKRFSFYHILSLQVELFKFEWTHDSYVHTRLN